ncbi:MAG TPA: DMT family transporter [Ktedonobacteraceae bacterium]|nr:DMT family transporter [Ktedonobacteraceae bacterium]
MWATLALTATVLTSILPILNKQLLRDARPALVAWAINVASLPLLAIGTLFLTQCTFTSALDPLPLSCAAHWPQIDAVFVAALLGSALLNWAAILLSTHALSRADASLVTPLLTFNPAFTLLAALVALREIPGPREVLGVVIILLGAYLMEVQEARSGLLAPLLVLLRKPGAALAIVASMLWGATTVLEKLAIEHVKPASGPLVALIGTLITVIFLSPNALAPFFRRAGAAFPKRAARQSPRFGGLSEHPRALLAATIIAGVAPLFGFTAIATGLVGYVTALFKLSAVFTILLAWLFLHEENPRARLLGAFIMVIGGALVAA